MKSLFSLMFTLFFLVTLLTTLLWYSYNDSKVQPRSPPPEKKSALEKKSAPVSSSPPCSGCQEVIKVMERYAQTWTKNEQNYQDFRSQLNTKCKCFQKAIITQGNTPMGSKLVYDGEKKRVLQVNREVFSTFVKDRPFPNKTLDTCAVVGNGGVLTNSSCGDMIDSTQFVIRCNLPPLENNFKEHVGSKTHIVTANPSIFVERYGALNGRRRPFAERLQIYGNSLLLIPAFSYGPNTPVSMRAYYTTEDFKSSVRAVFFNPEYLQSLAAFWRSQGLKAARLSTGLIMTSLALEVCNNVHLYGFWPFSNHPYGFQPLTNHYYDNIQTKKKFHAMPAEFELLLKLHNQGVLKLHLGQCPTQKQ